MCETVYDVHEGSRSVCENASHSIKLNVVPILSKHWAHWKGITKYECSRECDCYYVSCTVLSFHFAWQEFLPRPTVARNVERQQKMMYVMLHKICPPFCCKSMYVCCVRVWKYLRVFVVVLVVYIVVAVVDTVRIILFSCVFRIP